MNMPAMFAQIAGGFSSGNGAPYFDATAVWPGTPVYDDGGSITAPGAPVEYPCKAQFDAATQSMRAAEDFLETDVRVLVLSFAADLDTGASIVSGGRTWALITCQRDPAGIGWECRAREVK